MKIFFDLCLTYGADNWLSVHVALADHHLLSDEDLLWRNLDTEITTRHHDTIRFLENLLEATSF